MDRGWRQRFPVLVTNTKSGGGTMTQTVRQQAVCRGASLRWYDNKQKDLDDEERLDTLIALRHRTGRTLDALYEESAHMNMREFRQWVATTGGAT